MGTEVNRGLAILGDASISTVGEGGSDSDWCDAH